MGRSHCWVRTRIPLTYSLPPGRCSVEDERELSFPGCVSALCGKRRRGVGDGPDEAERLAGDGGDGDLLELAAPHQVAVAARQSMAGLVGDLLKAAGRRAAAGLLVVAAGRL